MHCFSITYCHTYYDVGYSPYRVRVCSVQRHYDVRVYLSIPYPSLPPTADAHSRFRRSVMESVGVSVPVLGVTGCTL